MEKIGSITIEYKGHTVKANILKDYLDCGAYEVFIVGAMDTGSEDEVGEVICGNDIKEFIDDFQETVDSL